MKKLKFSLIQKIFICAFFTLIISCSTYLILDFSFFNKHQLPEFSFQKFLKGEYQDRVSKYFAENTSLAKSATYFKTHFDMLAGKSFINGIYINKSSLIKIPKFPSVQDIKYVSEKINQFCYKTKQPIYSLIIPTKSQINNEQFLSYSFQNDDLWIMEKYNGSLDDAVIKLDALTPLIYIKDMSTFYKTDSNLTGWGAFLVYAHNIKQLGSNSCSISQFNIEHIVPNFYGKLFDKTLYSDVAPDVIDIFRYNIYTVSGSVNQIFTDHSFSRRFSLEDLSNQQKTDAINVVMGEPAPIKHISTNSKGTGRILIFSDQSINPLIHFLAIHYPNITIVNLEEVKKVDHKLKNSIQQINCSEYDQVLFAYEIENLAYIEQFDALDMFNLKS